MQAFEVERPTAVERRKLKPVSWIIAALLCAAFLAGLIGFCSRNGGNSASKVGSCKPGDVDSYAGIIHKDKGGWCLNNVCGDYRFDLNSGWLFGGEEKVRQFSCQRLQSDMLNLTSDAVWKLRDYFHILSSEIMTEIQKEENAGALFVVPAQLNGAEYPSATRVVHHVADYKEDIRGGPRGQLAAHPAVAQFLLDNAQSVERPKGINAADQIVDLPGFEVVNGYMKIQKTDKVKESLQDLKRRLNSLRLLVMEHVSTQGLVPKLSGFAKTSHRVGLVYASTIPVDSYVNGRTGESDPTDHEYQTQVAELMLVAQYYGALKYAAETTQKIVELTPRHRPRKVFLMPLGGGSFQNPWEIIGRSMAKAIQMLDHELLVTLEISALAFNQKPSEKEKLQSILEKLHSKVQIDERCIESGGSNHMVGAFRPTCQSDGSFAPQQCWGSTGFCWCSDKVGHEFRETRGRPGPRREDCEQLQKLKDAGNSTDCHLRLLKVQLASLVGAPEPTCLEHGGYAARQCWGSVDECWCADGTGKELEGTRGIPGPSLEECASKLGGSADCVRCTVRHQQQGLNCMLGYCIGKTVKTH